MKYDFDIINDVFGCMTLIISKLVFGEKFSIFFLNKLCGLSTLINKKNLKFCHFKIKNIFSIRFVPGLDYPPKFKDLLKN